MKDWLDWSLTYIEAGDIDLLNAWLIAIFFLYSISFSSFNHIFFFFSLPFPYFQRVSKVSSIKAWVVPSIAQLFLFPGQWSKLDYSVDTVRTQRQTMTLPARSSMRAGSTRSFCALWFSQREPAWCTSSNPEPATSGEPPQVCPPTCLSWLLEAQSHHTPEAASRRPSAFPSAL